MLSKSPVVSVVEPSCNAFGKQVSSSVKESIVNVIYEGCTHSLLFIVLFRYNILTTERGGSVVTHETRIREVPGSLTTNLTVFFFRDFPQSLRQMLGWIFITTIHLTIIHQIHIS